MYTSYTKWNKLVDESFIQLNPPVYTIYNIYTSSFYIFYETDFVTTFCIKIYSSGGNVVYTTDLHIFVINYHCAIKTDLIIFHVLHILTRLLWFIGLVGFNEGIQFFLTACKVRSEDSNYFNYYKERIYLNMTSSL